MLYGLIYILKMILEANVQVIHVYVVSETEFFFTISRKKIKNLSFNHFRLATLEQFLYTITAAVDWGSLHVQYKLF